MRKSCQKRIFEKKCAQFSRFHGYRYFFSELALSNSRYTRKWHTQQILAQTDIALLKKAARFILARVKSQHVEIAI